MTYAAETFMLQNGSAVTIRSAEPEVIGTVARGVREWPEEVL